MKIAEHDIHVYLRPDKYWTAEGRLGSYGITKDKQQAIAIARSAIVSASGLTRIIIFHRRHKKQIFLKADIHDRPSSQFFQDDVS